MEKKELAQAFAELTEEERADVLMAMVCNITGKKMPSKTFSTNAVKVLVATVAFYSGLKSKGEEL